MIRIGTAGWAIPRAHAALFPADGTSLARYAACFNAAEINTSFHRPHRPQIYARWAATVPDGFLFSVKLPRTITHDAKLVDTGAAVRRFADEAGALGDRLGPILVQLPPKLAFDANVAAAFFALARTVFAGDIVCEPRHPSWFDLPAEALLADHGVARVAADPARVPAAGQSGGATHLAYIRLHGAPDMYRSPYTAAHRRHWQTMIAEQSAADVWCMFDNTTLGHATADAAALRDRVGAGGSPLRHAQPPAAAHGEHEFDRDNRAVDRQ